MTHKTSKQKGREIVFTVVGAVIFLVVFLGLVALVGPIGDVPVY